MQRTQDNWKNSHW